MTPVRSTHGVAPGTLTPRQARATCAQPTAWERFRKEQTLAADVVSRAEAEELQHKVTSLQDEVAAALEARDALLAELEEASQWQAEVLEALDKADQEVRRERAEAADRLRALKQEAAESHQESEVARREVRETVAKFNGQATEIDTLKRELATATNRAQALNGEVCELRQRAELVPELEAAAASATERETEAREAEKKALAAAQRWEQQVEQLTSRCSDAEDKVASMEEEINSLLKEMAEHLAASVQPQAEAGEAAEAALSERATALAERESALSEREAELGRMAESQEAWRNELDYRDEEIKIKEGVLQTQTEEANQRALRSSNELQDLETARRELQQREAELHAREARWRAAGGGADVSVAEGGAAVPTSPGAEDEEEGTHAAVSSQCTSQDSKRVGTRSRRAKPKQPKAPPRDKAEVPATTEEESEAGSPAQTRRRGKARAAVRAQEEAKPAEEALEAEATADVAETEEAPSKTAAGPARYSLRKRPSSTLATANTQDGVLHNQDGVLDTPENSGATSGRRSTRRKAIAVREVTSARR